MMDSQRQRAAEPKSVGQLFLEGHSAVQIAEQFGLTIDRVHEFLGLAQDEWRSKTCSSREDSLAAELARIDLLEAEAWAAWRRSCQVSETTKVSKDGDKQRAERTTKDQVGDASFLLRIAWCIERRCKLLGLEVPGHGDRPECLAADVSVEQRRTRIIAILDSIGRRSGTEDDSEAADRD